MLPTGLRFDQAPPISVPFRFFLTAPIFLLLAAAVLLWRGPEVFQSRFSPAAIALTHLFTIGFMSMVMIGALMQVLPVLAGAPIPRPRTVAAITHAGLCLGALALAAGFLFATPWLLKTAVIALAFGLVVFLAAVVRALWRVGVANATTRGIWLAALSLLATTVFGLLLATSLGWRTVLPNLALRDLHPAWGMFGWLGLLALAVAYQVVPMFQMTPGFPAAMRNFLAAGVFMLLALWSAARWWSAGGWGTLAVVCALALSGAGVLFAVVTLVLQRRRRRRQPDVNLAFWKVALASLFAASVLWALRVVAPLAFPAGFDVLVGLLALAGFAGFLINGMLYKIAPFLAWFHAQALAGRGRPVPAMRKFLGEASQRRQFWTHVAALVLLVVATAWPEALVYPAALALGASAALLEANLLQVLRFYAKARAPGAMDSSGSTIPP